MSRNVKRSERPCKSEVTQERPLLVGREGAAHLCGVSVASWDRMTAAGLTPKPLKLMGRVVWAVIVLEAWIEAECPDRKTFVAYKSENVRSPK